MDSAGDRGFGPTAATGLGVPPVAARAYAILALLFAFQTINFFDKLAFGISGVSIMQEFSFTPKQFGLLGAAFFIVFAIGRDRNRLIFVGRYSNKSILLVLAAIWTISQFLRSRLPIRSPSSCFAGCCSALRRCWHLDCDGGCL